MSQTRFSVEIRRIEPKESYHLRQSVLWPTVSLADQASPSDFTESAQHWGAFLSGTASPEIASSFHGEESLCLPPNGRGSHGDIKDSQFHSEVNHEPQRPVGCIFFVTQRFENTDPLPDDLRDLPHVQLHKYAVLPQLQRQGIGRRLFEAAVEGWKAERGHDGKMLLHLEGRYDQREKYGRLGFRVLDEKTFMKYGPTGDAPGHLYARMGQVI